MAKKCPKGVICIENVTLFYIFIIIGLLFFFFRYNKKNLFNLNIINKSGNTMEEPPLKNNHYIFNSIKKIPINIQTQGQNYKYTQIGILTREDKKDTILPLMGRPLITNRSKWQYYTMNDKFNNIKLPISYNKRSCTGEYGCDELFNGDTVYVEGYKDVFKVTIYENEYPKYIPLI